MSQTPHLDALATDPVRLAIGDALAIAETFGHVEGAHHKAWVIDQMVRCLVGVDYEHWVATYEDDDEGSKWDAGIAP